MTPEEYTQRTDNLRKKLGVRSGDYTNQQGMRVDTNREDNVRNAPLRMNN